MTFKKIEANSPKAQSEDLIADNIAKLKALFPELLTEIGKGVTLNFDILKELVGDATTTDSEEKYGLNWHGKRRARQIALTPSTGTLRPSLEESVGWDTTQNLMIEGDNLEVLKLLQKSYAGKVKLIYIDPPYNTGKDFVYPDNFQDGIRNYLELTGQTEGGIKITTNTDASGRFHTEWLNMIYPRLKLARTLLASEGVIAISIGEGEISNLLHVCHEIFGEENQITICSRVMKTGGQKGAHFSPCIDYIVLLAKDKIELSPFREQISQNLIDTVYTKIASTGPRKGERYRSMGLYQAMLDRRANQRFFIECPDGELVIPPGDSFPEIRNDGSQVTPNDGDGVWRWTYPRFAEEKTAGNVEFIKSERTSLVKHDGTPATWNVYYRIWLNDRLEDGQLPGNILEKFESRHGSAELKQLGIPFDFPKPSALIKFLMSVCGVRTGDITMDFFAGSGSTAHAAMELAAETNEKYPSISIQLPEPTGTDSEEYKAGFTSISEITKERIRRAAKAIKNNHPNWTGDAGFRVFKLDSSNIRPWRPNAGDLDNTLIAHLDHIDGTRSTEDILYELLLKLGLELCVPVEIRKLSGKYVYSIGGGTLIVCLDEKIKIVDSEPLALEISAWREEQNTAGETTVVFRDSAFENDVAKSNLAAILEQNGLKQVRSL
ncbi:site-specific DNA-methyltransferase [Variovorax sp. 770b2]|uniref:site-specific DNA-methyltransferase n=1 Tax=Variovorax sp. 770b2 TaxID=1566271 RepID=UPI0008E5D94B|nr:site-specific DNA-methyltransferase [Variovorax sp. 770b2]SFP14674.1 adenine-specific DNA-methyltransferase [Variovorax sp. 770b2]